MGTMGTMGTITTKDKTTIYYKDWGAGRPVVLSHGWPLNSDSWESQALSLANNGFRVITHDRRGHGRSSQPWQGNDMDTYADDLAELIEALDLKGVSLFGFSTGGGEIARYIGRHGTNRVAKAGLIAAVPPLMLKTEKNPGGLPIEVFDGIRAASLTDRSQLYQDIASGPFFGFNRPGAKISQGMIDSFWSQGMQAGHKNRELARGEGHVLAVFRHAARRQIERVRAEGDGLVFGGRRGRGAGLGDPAQHGSVNAGAMFTIGSTATRRSRRGSS